MLTLSEKMPLLQKHLGPSLLSWDIALEELFLTVSPQAIGDVLTLLKSHESFLCAQLMDICVVDYLGKRHARFEVVYHLLSLVHNHRLRVKVPLQEGEGINSVTPLFSCADWWEREAYDMFGVIFHGHPDLRRILTDYDFEGFPLRKDFPLTGHLEVRYDIAQKKVIYEPVNLPQAFRTFDAVSPWQGVSDVVKRQDNT